MFACAFVNMLDNLLIITLLFIMPGELFNRLLWHFIYFPLSFPKSSCSLTKYTIVESLWKAQQTHCPVELCDLGKGECSDSRKPAADLMDPGATGLGGHDSGRKSRLMRFCTMDSQFGNNN